MIEIGAKAPELRLAGIAADREVRFDLAELKGRWAVVFFYPKDFSFVCPTEITGFRDLYPAFRKERAEVAGVSCDTVSTHREWAKELGGVPYPLLSDPGGQAARAWGAYSEAEGVANRATYLVDPRGVVQHAQVYNMNVGRSVEEVLRILQALATGRMCPADWQPGRPTLAPPGGRD